MVRQTQRRMMMALLVASGVGLLAAPALAGQSTGELVAPDGPFVDYQTGRVYDCRYTVGAQAKIYCLSIAYRQRQHHAADASRRPARRPFRNTWFRSQESDLDRMLREHRRRERQERLWERRFERDRFPEHMDEERVQRMERANARPGPARQGSEERGGRERPRGGRGSGGTVSR